jgi:hypothetical protein
VADFLERVPSDCPHDLFRDSERASQKPPAFASGLKGEIHNERAGRYRRPDLADSKDLQAMRLPAMAKRRAQQD